MKVEFIYDQNCPNVAEARAQVLRAFTETGISPRWVEWSRNSVEAPAYARGFGSPTLLVNGNDVAGQISVHGNACCRLYADPSGALRGAPSVEQIVTALQAHRLAGPTQRQLPLALPALFISLLPNLTCPGCWSAYGAVLGALGLGSVSTGVWLLPLTIISLLVALWGFGAAAIARRRYSPLVIGIAAAFALVIGKFFLNSNTLWISGLGLLIFASFWNAWRRDNKRACAGCARFKSPRKQFASKLRKGVKIQ
jgi:mercuric ion transport protein